MKKLLSILSLLAAFTLCAHAQTVVQAEYFFDSNDLGFGSCTPVTLVPAADSTWQLPSLPMAGLTAGNHKLFIRVQDSNQQWSYTVRRNFNIPASTVRDTVIAGEWFIDDGDLGYGQCNAFTVTNPDSAIIENLNIPPSAFAGLSYGNHKIYVRTLDNINNWSHTVRRNVEVVPADDSLLVVEMESFEHVDLGYGNCTRQEFPVPFTDGCWTFNVPYNGTTWNSTDSIFVRVRDSSNSHWSHTVRVNKTGSGPCYTGLSELNNAATFSIYPNPSYGQLTVELDQYKNQPVELSIYNMAGQKLMSKIITQHKSDLALSYPNGIYIVTLANAKQSITKKLVIQQ